MPRSSAARALLLLLATGAHGWQLAPARARVASHAPLRPYRAAVVAAEPTDPETPAAPSITVQERLRAGDEQA